MSPEKTGGRVPPCAELSLGIVAARGPEPDGVRRSGGTIATAADMISCWKCGLGSVAGRSRTRDVARPERRGRKDGSHALDSIRSALRSRGTIAMAALAWLATCA